MPARATPPVRSRALKVITKATRRPVKVRWPPDPARVLAIVEELDRLYPDVDCELDRENPFQLLCATILSAQCTDERVNLVTPKLFALFPTPQAMAEAPLPVLEDIIRSTGFFRQKAKSLRGAAGKLVEMYGGELPRTVAEMRALPGVARKTANVVLGTAFAIAEGVVVDTHVQRLAMRLGLTRQLTPEKIELDLMKVVPRDRWIRFSHQVIWHGRRVCYARTPDCEHCTLAPHCPSAFRESAATTAAAVVVLPAAAASSSSRPSPSRPGPRAARLATQRPPASPSRRRPPQPPPRRRGPAAR
jgi:endonuclease-3